jgi:hypothetical protein
LSDATCAPLVIGQARLVEQHERHRPRACHSTRPGHDRCATCRTSTELFQPGRQVRCTPRSRLAQPDHGISPDARRELPCLRRTRPPRPERCCARPSRTRWRSARVGGEKVIAGATNHRGRVRHDNLGLVIRPRDGSSCQ